MRIVDLVTDNPDLSFAPYQRMANAIAELIRKKGGCLPQDLLRLGFSKEETLDQWPTAHAIASLEVKLLSLDV